jgi:hypothetical protein
MFRTSTRADHTAETGAAEALHPERLSGVVEPRVAAAIQNAGYANPGQTPIWVTQNQPPAAAGRRRRRRRRWRNTGLNGGQGCPGPDVAQLLVRPDAAGHEQVDTQLARAGPAAGTAEAAPASLRLPRDGGEAARQRPVRQHRLRRPLPGTSDLSQSRYTRSRAATRPTSTTGRTSSSLAHAGDVARRARSGCCATTRCSSSCSPTWRSDQYATVEDVLRSRRPRRTPTTGPCRPRSSTGRRARRRRRRQSPQGPSTGTTSAPLQSLAAKSAGRVDQTRAALERGQPAASEELNF